MSPHLSLKLGGNTRCRRVNEGRLSGYGYTSMFPVGYKIGDWSTSDVEPVLRAEGLEGKPLWVEGSSYGAGIALGVAAHFGGGWAVQTAESITHSSDP